MNLDFVGDGGDVRNEANENLVGVVGVDGRGGRRSFTVDAVEIVLARWDEVEDEKKNALSGDLGGDVFVVETVGSLSARLNRSPNDDLGLRLEVDCRAGLPSAGGVECRRSEASDRTLRATWIVADTGESGSSSSASASGRRSTSDVNLGRASPCWTGLGAASRADATAELGSRPTINADVFARGGGVGEGGRARVRSDEIERTLRALFSGASPCM